MDDEDIKFGSRINERSQPRASDNHEEEQNGIFQLCHKVQLTIYHHDRKGQGEMENRKKNLLWPRNIRTWTGLGVEQVFHSMAHERAAPHYYAKCDYVKRMIILNPTQFENRRRKIFLNRSRCLYLRNCCQALMTGRGSKMSRLTVSLASPRPQ